MTLGPIGKLWSRLISKPAPLAAPKPVAAPKRASPMQLLYNLVIGPVLRETRGSAIIDVGDLMRAGTSQETIVNGLPDYYQCISVEDILSGKAKLDRDKKGLVITGYSWRPLEDKAAFDEEKRIQEWIRAEVNTAGWNLFGGRNYLLVLSNALPHENIFTDYFLPWHNGPFEHKEVFSIGRSEKEFRLTKYLSMDRPESRHTRNWIEVDATLFVI